MLRLKGQMESGEWVEFEVCDIALANKNGAGVYVEDRYVFIDPATIMLADDPRKPPMFTVSCPNCGYEYMDPFEDGSFECPECGLYLPPKKDPRKAMLNEIRESIYKYSYADWRRMAMGILDEMEAKL